MIPDQKKVWNSKHADRSNAEWDVKSDAFAYKVLKRLKTGDKLLELGCGVGIDARLFAQNGINTVATDFSEVVIEKNKSHGTLRNLKYEALDIAKPYSYDDQSFDCVYAYLSLHYFTDDITKAIFSEIHRVLEPNGILAFRCKSIRDRTYNQGDEVAPNIFVHNGHVRHLFTVTYAKEMLGDRFLVVTLEEAAGKYHDINSHFVDCIARKL